MSNWDCHMTKFMQILKTISFPHAYIYNSKKIIKNPEIRHNDQDRV